MLVDRIPACIAEGVYLPRGVCTCLGGVPAGDCTGGGVVPARGCTCRGGTCPGGVDLPGGCTCPGTPPLRMTDRCKILPCPKLRLRAVKMQNSIKIPTIYFTFFMSCYLPRCLLTMDLNALTDPREGTIPSANLFFMRLFGNKY